MVWRSISCLASATISGSVLISAASPRIDLASLMSRCSSSVWATSPPRHRAGLVAHTLDEQRDINDARSILGDAAEIKTDPEMVALAKQLIERQTTTYDPSDLEDRYETRLRAMIDAKLKGEGIDLSEPAEPDRTNVVDLMAALKKSLAKRRTEKGRTVIQHRRNRSVLRLLRRPSQGEEGIDRRIVSASTAPGVSAPTFFEANLAERTPDRLQGGQARSRPCRIRGSGNASVRRASWTSCPIEVNLARRSPSGSGKLGQIRPVEIVARKSG